jgi:PD-(D/E)XK nuclease superfamily
MTDQEIEIGQQREGQLARDLSGLPADCKNLEKALRKLNFFRAVGAAHAELHHSDFLAFLLNPREAHGVGDAFLKSWLRECLTKAASDPALSERASELLQLTGSPDLRDTLVWRERPARVDVFILNERLKFAIIVENKTDSGESERQLTKYWEAIEKEYSRFRRFGLYLSPHGSSTRYDEGHNYCPVGYDTLRGALRIIGAAVDAAPDVDLRILLKHYDQIIEDEFMGNPQASDLAWQIWQSHPEACAFLKSHERREQIRAELVRIVSETDGMQVQGSGLYYGDRGYVNFLPREWASISQLNTSGWLFWFDDFARDVTLWLGTRPDLGEPRDQLIRVARSRPDLFDPSTIEVRVSDYDAVWRRPIVDSVIFPNLSRREAFDRIATEWKRFLMDEFPALRGACAKALEGLTI